jgi:hypothetical protein
MASEDAVITAQPGSRPWDVRSQWRKLRERLTPRLAAAVVIWRVEARFATPLALVLIAAIGRWPAALTMGVIMGVISAVFLFLLDGEKATTELRDWLRERRFVKRYLLPIAEREDRTGAVQRAVSLPMTIMFMGPFFRAVTYLLFRVPRVPAYALAVLGSIPHSLLWTGLVLGGLYAIAFEPAFDWLWREALKPGLSAPFDAAAAVISALI